MIAARRDRGRHVLRMECVCGRPVSQDSPYEAVYQDEILKFCSVECLRGFEEMPLAFFA
jgi:YHS domain-containing protein